MKVAATVLVALIIAPFTLASDETRIAEQFDAYWSRYAQMDFRGAADFIHPDDLEAARTALLPVFLEIGEIDNPEYAEFLDVFFTGVPEAERERMSGKQVFVGLSEIIAKASPEVFEVMDEFEMDVLEILVGENGQATVRYRITYRDIPTTDTERLARHGGEWFVRTKEDPRDTAAKFRKGFGL